MNLSFFFSRMSLDKILRKIPQRPNSWCSVSFEYEYCMCATQANVCLRCVFLLFWDRGCKRRRWWFQIPGRKFPGLEEPMESNQVAEWCHSDERQPVRQLATMGALWHGPRPVIHQTMTSKQVPGQAMRLALIIVFFDYSSLIFLRRG